jgi:hypothetical protein
MSSYRKNATIVGVLFITCSAATMLSFPFSGPVLEDPAYLSRLAGDGARVVTGALVEFIWAAACAGIAIGLYPVLRRYHRTLALGSVGFRFAEGVLVLVGTLSLLALLTLSREFVRTGATEGAAFSASGAVLLALRTWAHEVVAILLFTLGALLYYFLLYRSRLVPRWLSGWGFLGALLSLASTLLAAFIPGFYPTTAHTLLNVPIGINEMALAVWLIVKGFNPSAIAALPVGAEANRGVCDSSLLKG